jgi:hypothetical protein
VQVNANYKFKTTKKKKTSAGIYISAEVPMVGFVENKDVFSVSTTWSSF